MAETYTKYDPFLGVEVKISHEFCDRLRGRYACGPITATGEPEFGWRLFTTPPVQHEAADRIKALAAALAASQARVERLEAALRPFVFGDAAMEQILWGHLPDTEPGTITATLGAFRRARAALSPDKKEQHNAASAS